MEQDISTKFSSSVKRVPTVVDTGGLVLKLCQMGFTWEEVRNVLGCSDEQLRNWLKQQPPSYIQAIEEARSQPNKQVEASLFRRALGYQTREIVKVEGKPIKVTIREIPPDVVASIFWLKNRDPKRWRETMTIEHSLSERLDRAHQALSQSPRFTSLPPQVTPRRLSLIKRRSLGNPEGGNETNVEKE